MSIDSTPSFIEEGYPDTWPPKKYFIHESNLSEDVVEGFRVLVNANAGESALDKYISKNPIILTAVLDFNNTGHHAAWVIPKKAIRPHVSNEHPGLIPDFIVGGRNSYGITWYVVELKGAQHKLFASTNKNLYLHSVANKGVCQLLEYMHFCNTAQSMLRDTLKLHGFIDANAFLFIGREEETNNIRKKDLKAAINNISNNLHIRSYDAFLKCCDRIAGSNST